MFVQKVRTEQIRSNYFVGKAVNTSYVISVIGAVLVRVYS